MDFPKMKKLKKADNRRQKRSLAEDEEVKKMAELILIEAKEMAKIQVKKVAEEVLLEAIALARWMKHPFYVA